MVTPLKAPNISALLSENGQSRSDETAYTILGNGHDETDVLTHGMLDLQARATAARLQQSLKAGDRALIVAPDNAHFIRAFMACQYAGVIAVPVAPPLPLRNPRKVATLAAIARDCSARAVLDGSGGELGDAMGEFSPELAALEWIDVSACPVAEAAGFRAPRIGSEDVSFLQYTSGSTSSPKGVMVSHRALLRNEEMFAAVMGMTSEDVIVSWLPLYHDMGLIGKVLQASYLGAHLVLMPSAAFVQRPARWLRAITRYRGTVSGGPNFAYDLCVSRIPEADRSEFDLSSWKVAFSGAEPIRPATFDAFAEAYAPHGLAPETLQTGYGLAEATLVASGGVRGELPLTVGIDRARLREGRVVPGDDQRIISVGRARLSRRFVIVDPATRLPREDGVVGEIWMSGDDIPLGYWGRPDTTEETFGARLADTGEGPFLRTGDLGVLLEGELYVTGRLKDVIIVGGRNHYPQDIEVCAEEAHSWIRPGCTAAFSVEGESGEKVVLVAEVMRPAASRRTANGEAPPAAPTLDHIRRRLLTAVSAEHGIQLDDIHLVTPASTFKTSSGKVQRALCRTAYEQGEFTLAPEPGERTPAGVSR